MSNTTTRPKPQVRTVESSNYEAKQPESLLAQACALFGVEVDAVDDEMFAALMCDDLGVFSRLAELRRKTTSTEDIDDLPEHVARALHLDVKAQVIPVGLLTDDEFEGPEFDPQEASDFRETPRIDDEDPFDQFNNSADVTGWDRFRRAA